MDTSNLCECSCFLAAAVFSNTIRSLINYYYSFFFFVLFKYMVQIVTHCIVHSVHPEKHCMSSPAVINYILSVCSDAVKENDNYISSD